MRGDEFVAARSSDAPELRSHMLDAALSWVGTGSLLVSVIFMFEAAFAPGNIVAEWLGIAGLLSLSALRFVRARLGDLRTALSFLVWWLILCTYFQSFRGPTPGSVIASAGAMLVAGVFFGRRGIAATYAAVLASLAVSAALLFTQQIEPWRAALWDPMSPLVWLRYAVVLGFGGGALAIGLTLVLRRLERTNQALQRTLERERAERTRREEAQRALHNAQRFQALSELAAGLAHDFNNSLMVILGGAECLREQPELGAESRELVEEINRRTQLASSTAKQLLALGRGDPGRPEWVQLAELLPRCTRTLQHALGASVRLELQTAATLPEVWIDAARLQQALLNLGLNARDAMPEGGSFRLQLVERKVDSVPPGYRADPGRYVALTCRDSGSGIEAALLERIFEPFFTTRPEGRGTGLGLTMVRKAIEDAGGFIEVTSAPGVGTTFVLYLPAKVE